MNFHAAFSSAPCICCSVNLTCPLLVGSSQGQRLKVKTELCGAIRVSVRLLVNFSNGRLMA